MAYDTLKAEIRQYIKTNGANEITGQILQNVLIDMVNAYPSLDGYATQQWVQNQGYLTPSAIDDMATQSWVNQQLGGYLPLTGGNLDGNLSIYDTMNIYSSSIEWNDDGDYCRITFDDDGITVTAHGTGYVIANEFIRNGGTSSQFLKADGSVDSNTYVTASALTGYLPLTGGNLDGNLSIYDTMNIYSSSIEWNDNGDYCRIAFNDDGVTVTAHGTGYVIANEFIRNGGTSSQFLKADGSVDSNNYLALSGGTITGNLDVNGTLKIAINNSLSFGAHLEIFRLPTDMLVMKNDDQDIVLGSIGNNYYVDFIEDIQGGTANSDYSMNTVNWGITTAGAATFVSVTQTSDIRRKNIISNLELSIEDIAKAPLFKFTWKDKEDNTVHIGTSAQYWQGLMPELTSENKNGVLGMQYDVAAMVGVTTVAKVVVDHEDRISTIERKLNIN